MKVVVLALLLALSSHLQLREHFQQNPFANNSYLIIDSTPDVQGITGITINFTEDRVQFVGCNINWAGYEVGENNSFSVQKHWIVTKRKCLRDNDYLVRLLLEQSTSYQLGEDDIVYLYDENQASLITLQKFTK